MPPQAGLPETQDVIDLTLSDDEDVSYVQPRVPNHSGHTASSLGNVPPTHHGLPTFLLGADNESEKRHGAFGRNYAEKRVSNASRSLGPNSSAREPGSGSAAAVPSNSRNHSVRPAASFENLSSRRANGNSPHNLANTAKRRKTTHGGVVGGRRSATSVALGAQSSPSSVPQRSSRPIVLIPSDVAAKPRTVITGASRLQSSFGSSRSPDEGSVQESIEVNNPDNHSMDIIMQVFELIKRALEPYHGEISAAERKEITTKTAAWLIRPELKTNYERNNSRLSAQYERTMAEEAKAYVNSYVETLRELNNWPMKLGPRVESEGRSSSSASEDIFERRHLDTDLARSRSYSESPTTELSNDQLVTGQLDGAGDSKLKRKRHASSVVAEDIQSLRRSDRPTRSQLSYAMRKRRRRNKQSSKIDRLVDDYDITPMDSDHETEHLVPNPDPDLDSRDELAGIKAVARTMQAPPKRPDNIPSEQDLLSLLRQREIHGRAPARVASVRVPFKAAIYAKLEDAFVRQSEWTDCSGDIQHISWINEDAFLCGATAHLDSHNMEYNKPGNLLLGSTTLDTLKSFPDHRIPRPIPDKLKNGESIHQTQDPWLYSSVVFTAHCKKSGFSFTASFDETVKIWSVHPDGSSMESVGTWKHDGKVNFVVTSDHHGRVATASGVNSNAVRVYSFNEKSISESDYAVYGGNKALSQIEDGQQTKPWSYQPATIQWGKPAKVADLLVVGYSPRSDSGDEADIPDEKKNSGELCVWNTRTGEAIHISASHTQNVFEVQWHPTQPIFAAATSPSGIYDGGKTKTQIRLFALNEDETFMNIQALDCSAIDINELTIMPNSMLHCYVTASCTDGNTYVYDTSRGDQPIHILQHGDPLDPLDPDLPREVGDTGVQFAAWGQTTGRFYTGSSDGIVKAWDIKAPQGRAYVRNVLSLAGAIISGDFSKDFSKLLVGDATGKVHLMSINDSDLERGPLAMGFKSSSSKEGSSKSATEKDCSTEVTLQQLLEQRNGLLSKSIKRPKLIIPHNEPPPPEGPEINQPRDETSAEIAKQYLKKGWLEQRGSLGVFQGANYQETGWYDANAHEDGDKYRPLLRQFHEDQQYVMRQKASVSFELLQQVKSSNQGKHEENMSLDLNLTRMSHETREALKSEGVEIEGDFDHTFTYELLPETVI